VNELFDLFKCLFEKGKALSLNCRRAFHKYTC